MSLQHFGVLCVEFDFGHGFEAENYLQSHENISNFLSTSFKELPTYVIGMNKGLFAVVVYQNKTNFLKMNQIFVTCRELITMFENMFKVNMFIGVSALHNDLENLSD